MPGYGDLIPIRSQLNEGEGVADNALEALTKRTVRNGSLFLRQLGLDMTEPGAPVPETNGVPRIFMLKDGRIRRLQEENITVGSRKFWETAMLGQIFAYPAGEKHPVQLQAWKVGSSSAIQTALSKPLEPGKIPDTDTGLPPQVPDKPRWYHRLFKFGRNRRLCDRYDRYLVEKENWRKNKDDAAKKSKSAAETIQTSFGSGRTFAALTAGKVTGVMSTGGSSVPGDAVAVMITGLGPRCVHKPEVVNKLTSEKAMAELDLGLDRLMKEEGLDKAGPRELSEKLVEENKLYSGDKLVEKFHKTNPQPGQAKETKPSELQTGIRREEAAEELVPQI